MASTRISDLTYAEFADLSHRLHLDPAFIERTIAFRRAAYARNLVCRTPHCELLVLCWEPGQTTVVHDHDDALNYIRVVRGTLTSRLFARRTPGTEGGDHPRRGTGPLEVACGERLTPGMRTGLDRPQIHQLANTSGERLVTVHAYAPPLRDIVAYDVETGECERMALRYTLGDDFA
ncbi:MAG TPA: cysteine dioxygenase family protein [Thermoleophilia bacterium]|nr:cysteine dioxygenase family protein [Thermoleophilia bacterium]